MSKALSIQSDTLSILLCNRINQWLEPKQRAMKIAKADKYKELYEDFRHLCK